MVTNTAHATEPSCYCTAATQLALAREVYSAIRQIQERHGLSEFVSRCVNILK